MSARSRFVALVAISLVLLLAWAFPILWSVLNSLKTDQDVLAYPPRLVFAPTVSAYRDVLFGSQSILPNLISSIVISVGTTIITMLMAVPAAYALARLRFRARKFAGFYVLATQMLPPVGIIIPYFLLLRNIGWIDTYQGIILIYLSFSLPFAIWLYVCIEGVAMGAEETSDVKKDIPRGYISGILTLRVLALGVMILTGGIGDWRPLASMDYPLPASIALVLGARSPLTRLFAGIGLFGLVASFHGIIISYSRQVFALARSRYLPPFLSRLSPRFNTPQWALAAGGLFGLAALLFFDTQPVSKPVRLP